MGITPNAPSRTGSPLRGGYEPMRESRRHPVFPLHFCVREPSLRGRARDGAAAAARGLAADPASCRRSAGSVHVFLIRRAGRPLPSNTRNTRAIDWRTTSELPLARCPAQISRRPSPMGTRPAQPADYRATCDRGRWAPPVSDHSGGAPAPPGPGYRDHGFVCPAPDGSLWVPDQAGLDIGGSRHVSSL